jgi:hypothetical protein
MINFIVSLLQENDNSIPSHTVGIYKRARDWDEIWKQQMGTILLKFNVDVIYLDSLYWNNSIDLFIYLYKEYPLARQITLQF